MIHHPDKNNNDDKMFKNIAAAYKVVMSNTPNSTPNTSQPQPTHTSQILPQLLNEITEQEIERYINDPDYCAQEKHDGRRKLIQSHNGTITIFNKKGKPVGGPNSFEQDSLSLNCNFIIDGEEVENFHCFDILSFNGTDLRNKSYQERFKHNNFLNNTLSLKKVYTAYTTEEKRNLYNKLKHNGKEGIVFKKLSGTHISGYSNDQVKFKWYTTASVIVTSHNQKASVSIAIYDNGSLIPIGNVTTLGHNKPPINSIIEVKYLYAYRGGSLYQPTFLNIRDDVYQEDCTLNKLHFKNEPR